MKVLSDKESLKAEKYFEIAWELAKNATCERSKCGCIIVKNEKIIWQWYNTPPHNLESQRRCICDKNSYHKKVTDKTCCIHAEQRAIMDALKNNPNEIEWADLYFIRLDKDWNISKAWKPYCTICSKMALDTWIKHFLLRHEEWITQYDTVEYNLLSYQYSE